MTPDSTSRNDVARADARRVWAEQVEREKQAAWAEVAADTLRVDERTVQLKALRLAKERSDAAASAAEAKKAKAKAPAKPRKTPSGSEP